MLSDEKKKAIKELTEIKELVEEDLKNKDYEVTAILDRIDLESLVIVLNLIEKQSKEIEELKEENEKYKNPPFFDEVNYTPNDKIKAKIEEYLEYDKKYKRYLKDGRECFTMEYYYAKMLQSLLEKE